MAGETIEQAPAQQGTDEVAHGMGDEDGTESAERRTRTCGKIGDRRPEGGQHQPKADEGREVREGRGATTLGIWIVAQ